jgi:hypothetical protein
MMSGARRGGRPPHGRPSFRPGSWIFSVLLGLVLGEAADVTVHVHVAHDLAVLEALFDRRAGLSYDEPPDHDPDSPDLKRSESPHD